MITITNCKVESFAPTWARYRGFSLLFDNPGESLRDGGAYQTLVTDRSIDFYKAIDRAIDVIGGILLTNTYLFAPLPYDSYHVTVWDGVNGRNLSRVCPQHQGAVATFIDGLPHSVGSVPPSVGQVIATSPLLQNGAELTFRFETLHIWGHDALVATLRPSEECIAEFAILESQRTAHNKSFKERIGTSAREEYCPHVSLGYFANQESAQLAFSRLGVWRDMFSELLAKETISFTSIGLYGFMDMATYMSENP